MDSVFFYKTYDFLQEFMPKQACKSNHTVKQYKIGLASFYDYVTDVCGLLPLRFTFKACTYQFLLQYKQYLDKELGRKPSTVNCRMAALRKYLEYVSHMNSAVLSTYISATKVPIAKVIKVQGPVISKNDLSVFLDSPSSTAKGNRDRFILILLYDTAIRVDELVKIRLGDIQSPDHNPAILIHGKGRKERLIVLSEKAAAHLNFYIKDYHITPEDPEAPLIYTVIHGAMHAMTARNVEKILHKYGEKTKESNPSMPASVYPHMIRRTRACGLYQDGVPMEQVAALLGHSNIDTTRTHYARPSKEQMKANMSKGTEHEPAEKEWTNGLGDLKRKFGLI